MTMIVDKAYYTDVYKGGNVEDFDRLNGVSQSFVEYLTRQTADQLLSLPSKVLEQVKQAICSEIDYLNTLGGMGSVNSKADLSKTSENYAGSYSYTVDSGSVAKVVYVNGIPYAPMIDIYLANTGLLYAGVDYVF